MELINNIIEMSLEAPSMGFTALGMFFMIFAFPVTVVAYFLIPKKLIQKVLVSPYYNEFERATYRTFPLRLIFLGTLAGSIMRSKAYMRGRFQGVDIRPWIPRWYSHLLVVAIGLNCTSVGSFIFAFASSLFE